MAFMNLNGWAVPIASCELSMQGIAESRGYSPNGIYQMQRNGTARVWRCRSGLLTSEERDTLIDVLSHRGDGWVWPLASTANGVEYVVSSSSSMAYSDKFRPPQNTEAKATIHSTYGADRRRVYDWNGNAIGPFEHGESSVEVGVGTTNLLSAANADPETNADLTAAGSATLNTSTRAWTGSGSVEVVTTASTSDGVSTSTVTGLSLSSGYLIGSVHIGGNGSSEQLDLELFADTGGGLVAVGTPAAITLSADTAIWRRYYVAWAISGTVTSAKLEVRNQVASVQTFYVDGLQLENVAKQYPSPWVDSGSDPWTAGSGVRPAGQLNYDHWMGDAFRDGWTIAAWVNLQWVSAAGSRYVVRTHGSTERALLFHTSANQVALQILNAAGGSIGGGGSAVSVLGWHHWAGTYDPATTTLKLYLDGALDTTWTSWSGVAGFEPGLASGDFSIGSSGSSENDIGPLGPIHVLPFYVPASVVSGWYQSGTDARPSPRMMPLSVSGDCLQTGDRAVSVYGQVDSTPHEPFWTNNATGTAENFEKRGGRVAFTLFEDTKR